PLCGWGIGALFSPQGYQGVCEPGQPSRVLLEVRDHRGCRTVPGEEVDVAAQGRQRRAELVGGVGNEPPLGVARVFEAAEHGVECRPEAADPAVYPGLRKPTTPVPRAFALSRRL